MRKKVFTVLSHCRECHLRASQKVSDNVPITPIVRLTLPFMVTHADLVGPLDPPSSQWHTYAFCVVDACTHWLSVYYLRLQTGRQFVIVLLICFNTQVTKKLLWWIMAQICAVS